MELTNTDIHKIIDDAMEKKDRTVMIFISDVGTTVSVNPIDNHKPHWISHDQGYRFVCSECGAMHRDTLPYCSMCGEKLAMPRPREDENGRD